MPIKIDRVELITDPSMSPALRVEYEHPGFGTEGKMPGHAHYVPLIAVIQRHALLGVDMEEAVEEIIYEALSAPDRDPDRFPGKADRVGAKTKHGLIVGLKAALKAAGIDALVAPPDEVVVDVQTDALHRLGREHVARARGVPIEEVPDLPAMREVVTPGPDRPNGKGRGRITTKMPPVARDRPVHARTPK
jgi:hypothetical protein